MEEGLPPQADAPPFLPGQSSPNHKRKAEKHVLAPALSCWNHVLRGGCDKANIFCKARRRSARVDTAFVTGESADGVRRRNSGA
jgi:hypothetical protein